VRGIVSKLERHSPKLFSALKTRKETEFWHAMNRPILNFSAKVADAVGAPE